MLNSLTYHIWVKKTLLLLVSGVMILVSCSTNAGKETEFTNEGIFCDLPSCLYDADDKVVALDLPSISDDVEEEQMYQVFFMVIRKLTKKMFF